MSRWAGVRKPGRTSGEENIKAHPEDPNAAEALALTVRATRYGCYLPPDKEASDKDISKEAFQLLHKHYSASGWTAKTPYYY